MSIIRFNGKDIHFNSKGKGSALVLLHGFLESLAIWEDFTKELSNEFQVISIDLPGHGKSECIDSVHTMELMADVVKTVLDFLYVKECVLIGHSMGGYVTLAFVKKYPESLKGFGLFHSHPLEETEEGKKNRTRTIDEVKKDHVSFVNQFIPGLFAQENALRFDTQIKQLQSAAMQMSKEGIIAALEGMKQRENYSEILRNNPIPFLAILGKQDFRIPYEKMLPLFSLPDDSLICIINHVGHMGYFEAQNETLHVIKCFMKKCFF